MTKGRRAARVGAFWALVLCPWTLAHANPPLPIDRAAKIAQEQLTSRGLQDKHYISSMKLEKSTVTSKETAWVATFTPSVPLGDRKELGCKIERDGSVIRLVDKPAKQP